MLVLGRDDQGQPFSPTEIEQGMRFSELAALVLDHMRLYDLALGEIDERAKAEQALRTSLNELKAQNADLDAFSRTVAHNLKQPLTTMIGVSQMLQVSHQQISPQDLSARLDWLSSTSQKMGEIITNLLLLAHIQKKDTIPGQMLDMDIVVAEISRRLNPLIVASRATIVMPESWPRAIDYSPWIEEVWANYLSNAIKYGGQPPRLTLGAEQLPDGMVCFWVHDNGPGLSKEQQEQIFTPFTRLHANRAEGHGLGLSIVQRIIEKLGGEVGVQSVVGGGSRFYFTLPAAQS